MVSADCDAFFALTAFSAREGFWVAAQLEPGTAVYNNALGIRWRGPLDVAALGETFNDLLARHPALPATQHRPCDRAAADRRPSSSIRKARRMRF